MHFGSKYVYLGNKKEDEEEVKVVEDEDVVLSDSDVSDDDGETCLLDILDTAGQEEYSSLKDQYVRSGDGFVIIYSIIDQGSFKEAEAVFRWLKRLRDDNCHVILVANKQDLIGEATVSDQDGKDLADKLGIPFFKTSAKDGSGVVDAMKGLIRIIPRASNDYKIIMLGSGAVGKSSITLRFVSDVFVDDYDPTIEDSYRKMISVDGLSAVSKEKKRAAKKSKKLKKASARPSSNVSNPFSFTPFSNSNVVLQQQQQIRPLFAQTPLAQIPQIARGGQQQMHMFMQQQPQQQPQQQFLFGQQQQQPQQQQPQQQQPQSQQQQPQQQQPQQLQQQQPQQQQQQQQFLFCQQQQQQQQFLFGQQQQPSQQHLLQNSNALFGVRPSGVFSFGNAAAPVQQSSSTDPSFKRSAPPPPAMPRAVVKKERKADGNVVLIAMKQLEEDPNLVTGDAIRCKKCEAILTGTAVLEADGDKKVWNCEFCGQVNKDLEIAEDEIPKGERLDYMLSPATEPDMAEEAAASEDCKKTTPGVIVYCMDISSSMAALCSIPESQSSWRQERLGVSDSNRVSRLECIQTAVERLADQLKSDQPEKQILLVAFGSTVLVKAGGTTENLPTFNDVDNDSFAHLLEKGVRLSNSYPLKPLSESYEEVSQAVKDLRTTGCTALGPALSICLGYVSAIPSSEIVLCTDGEPNVGVGTIRRNEAVEFYQMVGNHARSKNVTINILAVEGSSCGLQSVSAAAESSGGTTNKLNPAEIVRQLRSIAQNEVVATSVTVRFFLHPDFVFDEPEFGDNLSQLEKEVGSARLETDLTFRFKLRDPSKEMNLKTVPFQVQIQYTRKNGMKCLRVLSKKNEATASREEMEQNIQASVMSVSTMKTTAHLAKSGKGIEAQHELKKVKRLVNRAAKTSEQREARLAFNNEVEAWDDQLTFNHDAYEQPQLSDMATNMVQQAQQMSAVRVDTGAQQLSNVMGRKKMGSSSKMKYYAYKNNLM